MEICRHVHGTALPERTDLENGVYLKTTGKKKVFGRERSKKLNTRTLGTFFPSRLPVLSGPSSL